MPEPCIFAEFEAVHVDSGARRVGVTMSEITTWKTWRNESVVRRSSICVQVAYDYYQTYRTQIGQFGHGHGSTSDMDAMTDGWWSEERKQGKSQTEQSTL